MMISGYNGLTMADIPRQTVYNTINSDSSLCKIHCAKNTEISSHKKTVTQTHTGTHKHANSFLGKKQNTHTHKIHAHMKPQMPRSE